MSDLTFVSNAASRPSRRYAWAPVGARWMVTFAGFPAGGLAAKLIFGPVDGLVTAIAGGLVTGTILGAVQAWNLRRYGVSARKWIAATGIGLAIGLGIGASAVNYDTNIGRLAMQGLICGLFVGLAQASLLRGRLPRFAIVWPALLGGIWAAGWSITTVAGIKVDERFTVFGSSGAVVATALTAALPLMLNRRTASAS